MQKVDEIPVYFMVQSHTGKTHAINPKTEKTYCGNNASRGLGWRSVDVAPSSENEPTCKICQRHYDEPLREKLEEIAKDIIESIDEFLFLKVILKDIDGLGRFVSLIKNFMDEEWKLVENEG